MTGSRLTVPCSGAPSQRMLGSIPRAAPWAAAASSPLAPAQGKHMADPFGSRSRSLGCSAPQLGAGREGRRQGREGREAGQEAGQRAGSAARALRAAQAALRARRRRGRGALRRSRGSPVPRGGTARAGSSVRCLSCAPGPRDGTRHLRRLLASRRGTQTRIAAIPSHGSGTPRSRSWGRRDSHTDRPASAVPISIVISLCALNSAVFIYDWRIGLTASTYQAIFPFYAPYIQEERD